MAIDVHTHFVPPALADLLRERREPPWIETLPDGTERLHMPIGQLAFDEGFTDMAARIAFMDDHGIGRQVLSFPGLFGLDSLPVAECLPGLRLFNDACAKLCADRPGRFSGLAALPVADMDAAMAEYTRCRDLGLIGAILPNNAFVTTAEAEKMRPLFELGNEIGGHFFIHPGRRADEAASGAGMPPPDDLFFARQALNVQANVAHTTATLMFSDFLDDFPGITLHIANLGGTLPMVIERMEHVFQSREGHGLSAEPPMSRASRLHVDCSSLGARALELAVAIFGADRVMMGTDCPIFNTDWTLRAIHEARIDSAARDAILRGNAERLLGLAA